jgi:hypothetical protein
MAQSGRQPAQPTDRQAKIAQGRAQRLGSIRFWLQRHRCRGGSASWRGAFRLIVEPFEHLPQRIRGDWRRGQRFE